MASAFVLFNYFDKNITELTFKTISGIMKVTKENDILFLNFPSRKVSRCPNYRTFERAFGIKSEAVFKAVDFLILFEDEETIKNLKPDFVILKQTKEEAGIDNDSFGIIATAKAKDNDYDFVSRFFAPNAGIDEDPVTGRAHCSLIPFWSERLRKTYMDARQLSKRGGTIICEDLGDRVKIGGKAVCYSIGNILSEKNMI